MAIGIQVTFDADDPAKLAEFWTVALDYQIEPPPPGFDTWEAFADKIGVPKEQFADYSAAIDAERAKPRLFFQRLPHDGPRTNNHVHLDLNVSAGAPDKAEGWRRVLAHVDKLVAAGAKIRHESNEVVGRCMVMEDPEGNQFCVQ